MYFWRYVGFLLLLVLLLAPIVRSHLQQVAVEQDLHGIRLDYSLLGAEKFRARLNEVVLRNGLDLDQVEIQLKENRRESTAQVEIRYPSRMSFVIPWTRDVEIHKRILLRPVE